MALAELLEQTLSWLADLSAVGGGKSCEVSRTGTGCRHVTCGTFRAVALFKRARALRLSCSLFLLSRFVLYQF